MRYSAFVLLPCDVENLAEAVSGAMAPFGANRKLPPYPRVLAGYELTCLFEKVAPDHLPADHHTKDAWRQAITGLSGAVRERLLAEAPSFFGAVGAAFTDDGMVITTTLNEDWKWDGWSVGCDMCASIVHADSPERTALVKRLIADLARLEGPYALKRALIGFLNDGQAPEQVLSVNIELVSALLHAMTRGQFRRTIPAVVVTPRPVFGEDQRQCWHACAWPGTAYENDSSRDWAEVVFQLYELFLDHFAIRVECHR